VTVRRLSELDKGERRQAWLGTVTVLAVTMVRVARESIAAKT
jgi:hypothetical protein